MTTYYTYWFSDCNADCVYSYSLYKTFEKVCEAADEEIVTMLTIADEDTAHYPSVNIEELREEMEHEDDIEYYKTQDGFRFYIRKMTVEED
jgi:hypothetical protein